MNQHALAKGYRAAGKRTGSEKDPDQTKTKTQQVVLIVIEDLIEIVMADDQDGEVSDSGEDAAPE